jgi:hypothetical protein
VRFAFRLNARNVAVAIPFRAAGSYLLLDGAGSPFYVGRSDRCLRQHLLSHPLRKQATHFTATVAASPRGAYMLEAYWWHHLQDEGFKLVNYIHPAGYRSDTDCPFCSHKSGIRAA